MADESRPVQYEVPCPRCHKVLFTRAIRGTLRRRLRDVVRSHLRRCVPGMRPGEISRETDEAVERVLAGRPTNTPGHIRRPVHL